MTKAVIVWLIRMVMWQSAASQPSRIEATSLPHVLGRIAAEVAAAQAQRIDSRWEPAQRDCAGLVRFSIREAYRRHHLSRLDQPLFADDHGAPSDFADASALLRHSLRPVADTRSGDVLAFAQPSGELHLMILLAPIAGARFVVYHTGDKPGMVRLGELDDLERHAPPAWRPSPNNPHYLGTFRFKEWL